MAAATSHPTTGPNSKPSGIAAPTPATTPAAAATARRRPASPCPLRVMLIASGSDQDAVALGGGHHRVQRGGPHGGEIRTGERHVAALRDRADQAGRADAVAGALAVVERDE